MGVHILHDNDKEIAVLYCSTTGRPFGHGFHETSAGAAAETFLRYMLEIVGVDPRKPTSTELEEHWSEWHKLTHCAGLCCDSATDFIGLEFQEADGFAEQIKAGYTCLDCKVFERYAKLDPKLVKSPALLPHARRGFKTLTKCACCTFDAFDLNALLRLDDASFMECLSPGPIVCEPCALDRAQAKARASKRAIKIGRVSR